GGFGSPEARDGATRAEQLFGYVDDEHKASFQSWLIVDDALGEEAGLELRDGVAISPKTRTAEENQKYDIELLAAGTTFQLGLELWLAASDPVAPLGALVTALKGLEEGEIGLGQRKRRGLGQCHVENWRTCRYSLTTARGLLDWLEDSRTGEVAGLPQAASEPGQRRELRMTATFALDGSLLIRSGWGEGYAPDMVHLRSRRGQKDVPIMPGTSAAGAIRGRALRIANTVLGRDKGPKLIDEMFGRKIESADDEPSGSRVVVRETEVRGGIADLVQNRVKIDRFTGGSYPAALFSQQPLWGTTDGKTLITLHLRLRRHADESDADFYAKVGLLLLVLKDLWIGDLPLGGESSVGRGRLLGQTATIEMIEDNRKRWELSEDQPVAVTGTGSREDLENFVKALPQWSPKVQNKNGGEHDEGSR
ncbi:MAG: hypothetical protein L0387_35105, partial [Acidobacteria bacterium]|nr:hypothetical protein [Acidobacteriota bacterium]